MQKRVTISIDDQLNERWGKTARRLKLSKSGMMEEYLNQILPILETESPNMMIQKAMKEMAKSIDTTADLFSSPSVVKKKRKVKNED